MGSVTVAARKDSDMAQFYICETACGEARGEEMGGINIWLI